MIFLGLIIGIIGLWSLFLNIFFIIRNRYNKKTFDETLLKNKDYQRHCENVEKYFN